MHGGDLTAAVLAAQGVRFLFTLCGGHISPVLVAAKAQGLRVVDTRHEATAVFAADAVGRLTGRPGVAVVTAGPGVTNTVTAVANARAAQSPVVLIGGAAPTLLRGRGALQDIDQRALLRPVVKAALRVAAVRELVPTLERAFQISLEGVPGPVFVELPVDVLYDETTVRSWYGARGRARSLGERAVQTWSGLALDRLFRGGFDAQPGGPADPPTPSAAPEQVQEAARRLAQANRPVLLLGSQALAGASSAERLVSALESIGAPVYLSGMARGLLGAHHPLLLHHRRREAFSGADLVLLAGVPADFRLGYGQHLPRRATLISANRDRGDLRRNRRPDVELLGDAATALESVAARLPPPDRAWDAWLADLRARDLEREARISTDAEGPSDGVHPVRLCQELARAVPPQAVLVGDGGDIVATASQILRPAQPLHWLDPGVFGTLGVGAGFALGAALVHPEDPVWVLFGDGAAGYSLTEFDTLVRHGIPVVAVVGNDAGWTQIQRDQMSLLADDVGTVLAPTRYDQVVAGFGALGLHVEETDELPAALALAGQAGRPALVNVRMGRSDFRHGSTSM